MQGKGGPAAASSTLIFPIVYVLKQVCEMSRHGVRSWEVKGGRRRDDAGMARKRRIGTNKWSYGAFEAHAVGINDEVPWLGDAGIIAWCVGG